MTLTNFNVWVVLQLGIDVFLVGLFVYGIVKIRSLNLPYDIGKLLDHVQNLLQDADRLAKLYQQGVEDKKRFIQTVDARTTDRIRELDAAMRQSAGLLKQGLVQEEKRQSAACGRELEERIAAMDEAGNDLETIAAALSLPREKVKLVLKLKGRRPAAAVPAKND